jgi:hypothetical protein
VQITEMLPTIFFEKICDISEKYEMCNTSQRFDVHGGKHAAVG